MITLGSLFDGIGVFPLAASRHGIVPVWASEIEKAPISITKKHFPDMKHLGDITKLHGGKIPPVHIITFGSPCQNLSMMGTREGLSGEKSSLYYQAIRIIKEMRYTTNGKYPIITVWENVRGAFSSNDRMDFRAVLESFAGIKIPMPPTGSWARAGMVRGGTADICWRLMDARYWGEPALVQRRRRIFLVADFGGKRSAEILFKPRRMYLFSETGRESGLSSTARNRASFIETRGKIPVLHPFEGRRIRGAAKEKDHTAFQQAFGRADDAFPTLLTKAVNPFAFWYEGEETEGFIRRPTPLECERLMGLPDYWTFCGADGVPVSDPMRYRALGNSIAVPCAEYIMAGIAEALGKEV